MKNKYDFSGYATKNDLRCADGRVIKKDAFKHNDGHTVPLVWQHSHNDPQNVLGHAVLENREDGVYAYCTMNSTEKANTAKELVKHGDIQALSIHANKLKQQGTHVTHGVIREVSLVLAGANPGALIDNISISHGDGMYDIVEDEAIIYTGINLERDGDVMSDNLQHSDDTDNEESVQDIIDTMNEKQKNVMYYMVGKAIEGADDGQAEHSLEIEEGDFFIIDEGGNTVKHNVFDNQEGTIEGGVLSHADVQNIFEEAKKCGSLRDAVLSHAGTYGIDNIDILFPDAKNATPTPEMISRNMDWVKGVISGVSPTPFSRIKSVAADITVETARAKGYVTGNMKKEEVFGLLKRVTTPTTIYKKQKLDRDDIIDITDLNVVSWLKAEMRLMLDEELARAVLIGDGRDVAAEDKINEDNIRPIYKDADMYSHKVKIEPTATAEAKIETLIRARKNYKGTGRPTFYTTTDNMLELLLAKDAQGRRLYKSEAELASDLRVDAIVEVEPMEGVVRTEGAEKIELLGIMVNLKDYKLGTDKGGEVNMFDDFDIDYNQYKYLIETRCSGALIRPKSALVIEQVQPAG